VLQEVSRHFDVPLAAENDGYRTTFGLQPDQYLFHSEGLDLLGTGAFIRRLRGEAPATVRDLTVGELHKAILDRQSLQRPTRDSAP